MTEQNQSCLRFSLEESIWFHKGQEVSELFSLSIEPNVTISERNQYVVIEGSLEVSGEYRGIGESKVWENTNSTQEIQQRYVQSVERNEENDMFTFYHAFPVDISIPSNRIESRNLVEVDISTFDYSMPENSCIKLIAELMITGIYDDTKQNEMHLDQLQAESYSVRQEEMADEEHTSLDVFIPDYNEESVQEVSRDYQEIERVHQEKETTKQESEEYESFTVEAFAEPREESSVKQNEELPFQMNHFQPFPNPQLPFHTDFTIPMPTFVPPDVNSNNSNEHQPVRDVVVKQSIEDDRAEEVVVEVIESPLKESARSKYEESKFQFEESAEEVKVYQRLNREQEIKKVIEESEERDEKIKSSVSLTDFFAKKETHTQARLKVCIVQNGETIADLANRYHISKNEIISYNDLEDEKDVYEGQVLYIPRVALQK